MSDRYVTYQNLKKEHNQKQIEDKNQLALIDFEITELLKSFGNDEGNAMITYQTLANLEFDFWYPVGKGVKFKRIYHPRKPVFYITKMTPSESPDMVARFGKQVHDCKELCRVLKGELIEPYENNKRYELGDTAIFPKNFKHKPYATIDSKYEVEFLDPEK